MVKTFILGLWVAVSTAAVAIAAPATEHGNVISIDNVCISINRPVTYKVTDNIDFYQVSVERNGVSGFIYVGHNPNLMGENRKWQSHKVRESLPEFKIVELKGDQSGEILGIPGNEDEVYFHIRFEGGDKESRNSISSLVYFCK